MAGVNDNLTQIQTIVEPVSSSGTEITDINNRISLVETEINNVPNGGGGPLTINYPSPISSPTPTGTVSSLFPSILGIAGQPGTLLGNASLGLQGLELAIQGISLSADTF